MFTHTCHLFEVTETSFTQVEACCGENEASGFMFDMNCCSIEHNVYQQDTETDFQWDLKLDFTKKLAGYNTSLQEGHLVSSFHSFQEYAEPPPRKFNRNILTQHQVFRL